MSVLLLVCQPCGRSDMEGDDVLPGDGKVVIVGLRLRKVSVFLPFGGKRSS